MEEYISRFRRAQEIRILEKAQTRAATVAFRDDMLMSSPPSCSAANFKRPRLRKCFFDPATINWSHSSRVGGGIDGYIWKVWFGVDGPYALKVVSIPDVYNAASLFSLSFSVLGCQSAELSSLLCRPEGMPECCPSSNVQDSNSTSDHSNYGEYQPKNKDEALANLYWFSNEGRQMNTSAQGAHAEEIVTTPRIRKCYGWTRFSGHSLLELPKDLKPPVLQVGKFCRSISTEKEYTAIVYEYVEEGENRPDVVEEADRFFWLGGFSHSSSPAARNWKSGVLVDLSDIIHAGGYGWYAKCYGPW